MTTRGCWAVVLAVAGLLVGCTRDDGLNFEPPTGTPSSAANETTEPSEEERVLTAYRDFYVALEAAGKDPERASEILAPVATSPQLEQTPAAMRENAAEGIEGYGVPEFKAPVVASLDETTAQVNDCQDTSKVGSRVKATGEGLTHGLENDSVTTRLQLVDGAWKVSETEFPEDPMEYCR